MIYNTKMLRVNLLKFGNSERLLVQGINYVLKLLVPHEIYWFRTGGQAAISNTADKL